MSEASDNSGLFRKVVVVAWPGFGVGAQPDAQAYRDRGANTLGNVAVYMGGLDLTILHWLGLGNVAPIRGVAAA
ncbi:MAG: phosphopentomutase, partial [Myxococcota bacterium]